MAAGKPQQPEDYRLRRRSRVATSCQVIGAVTVIATLVCSLLGVISAQQAVALGLPAVVLTLGGLIAIWGPDPQTGHRLGFQAGLHVGVLIKLWRSVVRRHGRNS